MEPRVETFFETKTKTATHLIICPTTNACAIIDSVLDYDHASGRTSTTSADAIISFVRENDLSLRWILETHLHADHLTAAPYLKSQLGGQIGIGARIGEVQRVFADAFGNDPSFEINGNQFDVLFSDGDTIEIGALSGTVLETPGHTPACITFQISDCLFVGDTLFMPDSGTARCDFPGGDAATLYESIQRLLSFPPETHIFLCHDYGKDGSRDVAWRTTVGEQRSQSIHVRDGISEADFVALRTKRDATLSMPALILPSVQVNMRAGKMPPADADGIVYLKIPINTF